MADHQQPNHQQQQQQQQTSQPQHQQPQATSVQQGAPQVQQQQQQPSQQQQQQQPQQQQPQNVSASSLSGQNMPSNTMNTMAANAAAVAAAGIRNPIPQVQVIPQMHSPPYISQFPYNQQQQIMLQNAAMQAAMQASAMNMNPQQFNMNMNMAAMAMQGRPQSVSGNISSPANLMSPSPTTPTQQNPTLNFTSAVTSQVTNSNTQATNGKVANGNKGQTSQGVGQTQQAQATPLVGGKPIMPTQAVAAGGPPPLVLGQLSVLPNQLTANTSGFVTAQSKGQSMTVAHTGQPQVISSQAPLRFTQPQLVSSTGQIITSQPMLTNQAVLQAMANLQQQGIPLAHQPLLSAPGQSPTILSGQSLFIRPANQIPQQGMMTAGVQTIGTTMKQGTRVDMPQNLQVKASPTTGVGISKQAGGAQGGKTILPQLQKTAMAKVPPTPMGGQRPKLSIPSLPRKPNRGRPCNPNKVAAVTTATAATNTVASALSQAKVHAVNQSKPTTHTSQAVNLSNQTKCDSEIEAGKKTADSSIMESIPTEARAKDKLPDVVNSTSDQATTKIESSDKSLLATRDTPVVVEKQKAIVKPHILTHVIEGFVIQEGPEPFPVERSSLLTEFIPPKPGQSMEAVQVESDSVSNPAMDMSPNALEESDSALQCVKCEFCGKEEKPTRFRRSKRFCSMPCAKRFNVACSKRISLLKAKASVVTAGKVLKKRPSFAMRKVWRAGGRGRLAYNIGQKLPGEMDMDDDQYNQADNSSSPSSENESSTTPDSPNTEQGQGDMDQDTATSNPGRWNVLEVYEFIKSMPGCAPYAEEFRSQEIDGQALMLLKEDHLMTAMNMKLGPALKICARINTLKDEAV